MERTTPSPVTLIAGAIAGVVPFVISNARGSYSVVNGEVVAATYRDWIAVGGGTAAVILGLAAIATFARSNKAFAAAGLAIAALGGYQIARGMGAFWTPPVEERSGARPMSPTEPPPAAPVSKDPASCPDLNACDNLAWDLKKTDLAAYRIAKARSCGFGAGYGCAETAEAWRKDDAAKAREFFDKACTLKHKDACNELGVMHFQGEGGAKDEAKGVASFEKACALGHGLGCKNLAIVHRDGTGAAVDLAKATAFAVKACAVTTWTQGDEGALAWACNFAGTAYLNGEGVTADKKLAVEHYGRACDRAPRYCFNLAASFHEGVIEKDLARATELYAVACDAGQPDACNNLGDMLNRGEGGAKDLPRAKQLFGKACDAGLDLACTNLKQMK